MQVKLPLFAKCLPLLFLSLPKVAMAERDTITTRQGVEVFIKNNQSRKLKLIVEGHLADLESNMSDYARVGTGVNADFIFRRFLSVHAGYSGTYFSWLQKQAKDLSYTQNRLRSFSVADAGVRLHILDGKGWAKRKITLQSFKELNEKGMPRTTVRFLKAKYPCRRIVALRGGLYVSNAPISANVNADITKILEPENKGSVTATDGTVLTGDYYTNTYTTGVYAGITKIINMKFRSSSTIEWLEGESRLTALFKENYIDVIFATTTVDPFMVSGKEYVPAMDVAGGLSLSNIGWRIGGRLLNTQGTVNTGVNYEVGSRPGVADKGYYIHIGVTIAYMK